MPLKQYGVLKAKLVDRRVGGGPGLPPPQLHVTAEGTHYRCAVNVESTDHSALLYLAEEAFIHPLTTSLAQLPAGFTRLNSAPGGLALDYIRANLLDPRQVRAVPPDVA